MSWRITEPQIAGSLASIEPDPNKREARAKAIFDTIKKALEESFSSAPNVLFVAGAGKEVEDVDFVRSFPAGLNLPNVITVGAVGISLQPAGFTSYASRSTLCQRLRSTFEEATSKGSRRDAAGSSPSSFTLSRQSPMVVRCLGCTALTNGRRARNTPGPHFSKRYHAVHISGGHPLEA